MKSINRVLIGCLVALGLLSACAQTAGGPQAWIDRPLDDSILPLAPLKILVHASDSDGVSQFQFAVDGDPIADVDVGGGRLSDASIEWTPPAAGTYLVEVRAVDSVGNLGSLAVARVTIGGDATPTSETFALADTGTEEAQPVETTFANITNIECGPDQTVLINLSIGNPQGVLGYSLYSTWADVNSAEVFSEPLPVLVENRVQLIEPVDTVDRDHQFTLAVEIPGQSTLIATNANEPGGRCPGHYQEEVEMAPPNPIAPLVNATQNANCRSGPALEYDLVTTLLAGQSAEITGRNTDSSWWVIDPGLGGKTCWIAGSIVDVSGDISGVGIIAPPPLPVTDTPTPTLEPTVTASPTIEFVTDTTPPSFFSAGVSPESILTDGGGCPGYDRTFVVAAAVADEGGLSSVYAIWSLGEESGTVTLSEGSMGYSAEIGPVYTAGTMTITLYAEDTSGNTAQHGPLFVTVQNCIG